ncbi:cyclophilin-like fold protein [Acinetobacter baumannii]|uniref:cyclophilin-like fold protein n=1 Tax=Acinetobacter baumannii TaxID=470 RepID=UPI003D063184
MEELNGNQKHTPLLSSLPTDTSRPDTINNGDLVRYGSSTMAVFYDFSKCQDILRRIF